MISGFLLGVKTTKYLDLLARLNKIVGSKSVGQRWSAKLQTIMSVLEKDSKSVARSLKDNFKQSRFCFRKEITIVILFLSFNISIKLAVRSVIK